MAQPNPKTYNKSMVHYIRYTFAYNTANIATGVLVGTIPSGSVTLWVKSNVTTAFNAGTTNTMDVGFTAGGTELVAAGALGSAAGVFSSATNQVTTADKDIYVQYDQTGTAATAGAATVTIAYAPDV